jgi:hypothetical protein
VKEKRIRKKREAAALTHVNLRIPDVVLGFYKQSPSYTKRMREILTDFAYGDIDYMKNKT